MNPLPKNESIDKRPSLESMRFKKRLSMERLLKKIHSAPSTKLEKAEQIDMELNLKEEKSEKIHRNLGRPQKSRPCHKKTGGTII